MHKKTEDFVEEEEETSSEDDSEESGRQGTFIQLFAINISSVVDF